MARVCPKCKGKKVERCKNCKGTGTFYPLPLLGLGAKRCNACGGKGYLGRCLTCGGTGKD
ncbi:MAG: hypothetical protein ABIJ50_11680 [Pseudomonadota bacterium]